MIPPSVIEVQTERKRMGKECQLRGVCYDRNEKALGRG